MSRKTTSDVGQWWKIIEIHHGATVSCKMICFSWKEKEHRTLVNDEILLKFRMMREILKWYHFDEEKNTIGRWSMMKYYWNSSSSWEKFVSDAIFRKRRRALDVGQCWHILAIHDPQRNSKVVSLCWWQEERRTLVNDITLLKFLIIVNDILKWRNSYEEKKNKGRSSIRKYCWNSWLSRKFWNDPILTVKKGT